MLVDLPQPHTQAQRSAERLSRLTHRRRCRISRNNGAAKLVDPRVAPFMRIASSRLRGVPRGQRRAARSRLDSSHRGRPRAPSAARLWVTMAPAIRTEIAFVVFQYSLRELNRQSRREFDRVHGIGYKIGHIRVLAAGIPLSGPKRLRVVVGAARSTAP
jgi:hypothetical protein